MLTLTFFLTIIAWGLTAGVIYRQARQLSELRAQVATSLTSEARSAAEMKRTVSALLDCSRGVNETLHAHDSRLRQISFRQEEIALHEHGSARYREAVALLRRGAEEGELVDSCGLSQGEAHLIAHLERLQNRVA